MLDQIESVRRQLIQAVAEKKSFTDVEIVRLSQQLDFYLVEFEKRRNKKLGSEEFI
ncbi:aspartyl-phosphate phosphatase Spo0E family protein [Paenibacillus apiarius]|uniref:aspartyl-phosphate phosphatase Spo0E family protein n=1 Tax=Paenibacillus apiarius TaxID=46240 RepID=UPI002342E3C9|nr:aspartyl-phosphate phosphatase Spo0E family protein [Paenibacillus apiarius]